MSKSALAQRDRTLAQALAPKLRVNAVAPGPTLPSPRQTAEQFARQAAAVPLKRGPTPEDIAAAVVYLARRRSVTGTVSRSTAASIWPGAPPTATWPSSVKRMIPKSGSPFSD